MYKIRKIKGYWQNQGNRRTFLSHLERQLLISNPNDWYEVTWNDVVDAGGGMLLSQFENSISKMITSLIPNYNWKPWKFRTIKVFRKGNLQSLSFLIQKKKYNIHSEEGWYKITNRQIIDEGGKQFLSFFNNSLFNALSSLKPEISWKPHQFARVPQDYWTNSNNQKSFFEDLSKKLNIHKKEELKKLKNEEIVSHGGSGILQRYQGSSSKALKNIFPSENWEKRKPIGYWGKLDNIRSFFQQATKELKINSPNEWYNIRASDLIRIGGSSLFNQHYKKEEISSLIQTLYPEHFWESHKFDSIPKSYWNDFNNHKKFLEEIAIKLEFQSMEDWYNIRYQDIIRYGGTGMLLTHYKGSIRRALRAVYPTYNWIDWKFGKVTENFWKDEENIKAYLQWLGEELKLDDLTDWKMISRKDIEANHGYSILNLHNGLANLLEKHLPGIDSTKNRFNCAKSQKKLQKYLGSIFC